MNLTSTDSGVTGSPDVTVPENQVSARGPSQAIQMDGHSRAGRPDQSAQSRSSSPVRERLLIFSRKGFDSSFGGRPSPRLPDGRMVSLPIPEPGSPITYQNCFVQPGRSFADVLGQLGIAHVAEPHGGKSVPQPLNPCLGAHLDPDLRAAARPRPAGWRPLFGQAGIAQQHLANQGVAAGDVFVFFGWFRDSEENHGELRYARRPAGTRSPGPPGDHGSGPLRDYQAIWGWMEIGEVMCAADFAVKHPWAVNQHPHLIASVARTYPGKNTVYMAAPHFSQDQSIAGAGVLRYSDRCRLTAPDASSRRWWSLPDCFHPQNTTRPMTYHPPASWSPPAGGRTTLRSACIGQEFVVPVNDGIEDWLKDLLINGQPW